MVKKLSDTTVMDGQVRWGKTGFTSEAGCCLASFAEIDDIEYMLGTAGAYQAGTPQMEDGVKLYNRLGEASSVLYGK